MSSFYDFYGLLVQEASGANAVFGEFFIRAVHVRWIQLGGAMVVPIWPNREREYYEDIITKVNGIYLPGGGTDPLDSYYGRGVKILMELVMRENDRGVHMPVWAICLGLQSLLCHRVGKIVTLNGVDEKNRNTALEPAKDFEDSFLKKNIPSDILSIMLNNEILPHHHNNCITTKTFNSSPEMNEFFKLVSVNTTRDGTEYVATIEGTVDKR
ncbi:gamma-glutamyl hydrolase-like [Tubulanus polymorphus]|uniref:gamma-glutamyl hydrolase-like n=1 Tax=Tubulanus polymorphus TaxID=672921 RepID=UPI003DA37360